MPAGVTKNRHNMENLYTPNCIRTFTGHYIDPFNPNPDLICIEDIAHSLSNQCRFAGHLPKFYSIAEHCIYVTSMVSNEKMLEALLHDASEAYLLDMPSPIKKRMPQYIEMENKLMAVIAKKFGFNWPLCDEVKRADKEMCEMEWGGIFLETIQGPFEKLMTNKEAENAFLKTFGLITKTT